MFSGIIIFVDDFLLPILLYDSECTLCMRFAQSIEKIDKQQKINLVSIYTEHIYQQFKGLDRERCDQVIHFIDENKVIYEGPDAIEQLIKILPNVNKFSWLIENEMGKKALDFFYKKVSAYRKRTKDSCPGCNK